jgi:hypothetical protein
MSCKCSLQPWPSVLESWFWLLCGRDAYTLATLSCSFSRELASIVGTGKRGKYARRLCRLSEAVFARRGRLAAALIMDLRYDLRVCHAGRSILRVFDEFGMVTLLTRAALYRSATRSRTPDWEVRFCALLFMRDWSCRVVAFDVFLNRMCAEGGRGLAPHHNSIHAATSRAFLVPGHVRLEDSMLHLQCAAAVVAGDVTWLATTAPVRRRPRNFFPATAPGTPR